MNTRNSSRFSYSFVNTMIILIASVMCLRLSFLGLNSTTLPYSLGFPLCVSSLIYIRFRKNSLIGVFVLVAFCVLHSLNTNLSLKLTFKVITLILIYYTSLNLVFSSAIPTQIFSRIVTINIAFLLLEAGLRIFFGEYFRNSNAFIESENISQFLLMGFYKYKLGSPFFYDSNFVGIHAFLVLLMHKTFGINCSNYRLKLFLLIIIILLSFSRSIIACLILIGIHQYFNKISFIFKIPLILILVSMAIYAISFLLNDWSFQTKLEAWKNLFKYDFDINGFLFGYGVDDGKYIFGWSDGFTSHSLIPSLIGEFGFLGVLIFCFTILFTGGRMYYNPFFLLFLIMVIGVSLFDPLEPLLYFNLGISAGLVRFHYEGSYKVNSEPRFIALASRFYSSE
jgi:hypothetical protein